MIQPKSAKKLPANNYITKDVFMNNISREEAQKYINDIIPGFSGSVEEAYKILAPDGIIRSQTVGTERPKFGNQYDNFLEFTPGSRGSWVVKPKPQYASAYNPQRLRELLRNHGFVQGVYLEGENQKEAYKGRVDMSTGKFVPIMYQRTNQEDTQSHIKSFNNGGYFVPPIPTAQNAPTYQSPVGTYSSATYSPFNAPYTYSEEFANLLNQLPVVPITPTSVGGRLDSIFSNGNRAVEQAVGTPVATPEMQSGTYSLQNPLSGTTLSPSLSREIPAYQPTQTQEVPTTQPAQPTTRTPYLHNFGGYAMADVDMNSAGFLLGQSLRFDSDVISNPEAREQARTGNILRGVGAGAKLAMGLARTIGSGMGWQNRMNEWYKDYTTNIRKGQVGRYGYMAEGGQLSAEQQQVELMAMSEQTGIPIEQLIQMIMNGEEPSALGKSGGNGDAHISTDLDKSKLPESKLMTGAFTTGLNSQAQHQANAEVEQGEYIKKAEDGAVLQVEGDKHSQGGELVHLNKGDIVISDQLKIGKDNAKRLQEEYGLKVSATDTYASVIDKYSKSLGLDELNAQQEELFEKAHKNSKLPIDVTSDLNNDFLSNEIHAIEQQKSGLLEKKSLFTDVIYEMQEVSKLPSSTPQTQDPHATQEFSKGGMFAQQAIQNPQIQQLMTQYGITPEQAISLLTEKFNEGGGKGKGKYDPRTVSLDEVPEETITKLTNHLQKVQSEQSLTYENVLKELRKEDPDLAVLYDRFIRERMYHGYSVARPQNVMAHDMQHRTGNTNNLNVYGGVDLTERNAYWKQNLGHPLNNIINIKDDNSWESVDPNLSPSDAIKKLQRQYNTYLNETQKFALERQFANEGDLDYFIKTQRFDDTYGNRSRGIDGKLGQYTSSREALSFKVLPPDKVKRLNDNGIYTARDLQTNFDKVKSFITDQEFKHVTDGLDKYKDADYVIDVIDTPPPAPEQPVPPAEPAPPAPNEPPAPTPQTPTRPLYVPNAPGAGLFYLPDQSKLPPNPIIQHVKVDHTYDRIDPIKLTNNENMKGIFASQNLANAQINALPDSQRGASLANLVALSQDNINRATTQIEQINAQNAQQTEMHNANIQHAEENARVNNILNYEQRALTAYEKTIDEFNRYMDYNDKVRLHNYSTWNRLSNLNNMFDNIKVDPFGVMYYDKSTYVPFGVGQLATNGVVDLAVNATASTPTAKQQKGKTSNESDPWAKVAAMLKKNA